MKRYLNFYNFVLGIKSYVCLYTVAFAFLAALQGYFFKHTTSLAYVTLLQFFLVSWVLAGVQFMLFPSKPLERAAVVRRSCALYVGWLAILFASEWIFGWFGVTGGWWLLFLACCTLIYYAVWIGFVFINHIQNAALNQDLTRFKQTIK